jgi:coenzyme F420-reducing hydrogenase gamma subunit
MAVRPKVAFFEFTSCEGCQLTVVDSLQTHPELLEAVEIVRFREAMSEKGDDYLLAFIEGSCTRQSDEAQLKAIRGRAGVVLPGRLRPPGRVNAIRRQDLPDVRRYVYGDKAEWYETPLSRPSVIPVDAFIPAARSTGSIRQRGQGRAAGLAPAAGLPLCVECKLKENVCLYLRGKTCLGPITRAGCDAICPTYGDACEGCRGLIPNPNIDSLKTVLGEHGLSVEQTMAKMTMFLTYQTMESEAAGHGNGKR